METEVKFLSQIWVFEISIMHFRDQFLKITIFLFLYAAWKTFVDKLCPLCPTWLFFFFTHTESESRCMCASVNTHMLPSVPKPSKHSWNIFIIPFASSGIEQYYSSWTVVANINKHKAVNLPHSSNQVATNFDAEWKISARAGCNVHMGHRRPRTMGVREICESEIVFPETDL